MGAFANSEDPDEMPHVAFIRVCSVRLEEILKLMFKLKTGKKKK